MLMLMKELKDTSVNSVSISVSKFLRNKYMKKKIMIFIFSSSQQVNKCLEAILDEKNIWSGYMV